MYVTNRVCPLNEGIASHTTMMKVVNMELLTRKAIEYFNNCKYTYILIMCDI